MAERGVEPGCVLCRRPGLDARYVRIEAGRAAPGERPRGLFGLLRELRLDGRLPDGEAALAAALVDRAYELHDEPPAAAFEGGGGVSWFVAHPPNGTACAALGRLCGDVAGLLDRHGVVTRVVRTADPGRVTHADAVQVVAVPRLVGPGGPGAVGAAVD